MSPRKVSSDSLDAAAVKVVLQVHGGIRNGQHLVIGIGESVIGSSPQAAFCLTGRGVREEHCRINCSESGATLESAEPGIHVNGVRAVKWTLQTGDWIAVGPVQLEVLACPACPPGHIPGHIPGHTPGCSPGGIAGSTPDHVPSYDAGPGCDPNCTAGAAPIPDSMAPVERFLAEAATGTHSTQGEVSQAASGGVSALDEPDDSREIQRYMQALLERVGGAGAKPPSGAASHSAQFASTTRPAESTGASAPAARPAAGAASPCLTPTPGSSAATPSAIDRLRVRAPQNPIDLSQMRALANNSARAALHSHARKTIFSEARRSAAVAVLAMVCGAGVVAASHFEFIAKEFLYAGATVAVIGVLLGFGCLVKAASGALRRSPAAIERRNAKKAAECRDG